MTPNPARPPTTVDDQRPEEGRLNHPGRRFEHPEGTGANIRHGVSHQTGIDRSGLHQCIYRLQG